MKFSIKSDVLKNIFENFIIGYPIILSYHDGQFNINQIIGEETLVTFRVNDDCIKLPKKKRFFSGNTFTTFYRNCLYKFMQYKYYFFSEK